MLMSRILSVLVLLVVFSFGIFNTAGAAVGLGEDCSGNPCGSGLECENGVCKAEVCGSCDSSADCLGHAANNDAYQCRGATSDIQGLCQETGKTAICNPLKAPSFTGVIDNLLRFLFNIAIVVAPIVIITAGFMFLTGGDNPDKIYKAKMLMMWAAIGFIIILLSRGLITVIEVIIKG